LLVDGEDDGTGHGRSMKDGEVELLEARGSAITSYWVILSS
jgi:hypothetical protein